MLKEELDKLTGHKSTVEEFDVVEAWYMAKDTRTKEDAAKLWKRVFLQDAKEREAAYRAPITVREVFEKCMELRDGWQTVCIRSHVLKVYHKGNRPSYPTFRELTLYEAGKHVANFWYNLTTKGERKGTLGRDDGRGILEEYVEKDLLHKKYGIA